MIGLQIAGFVALFGGAIASAVVILRTEHLRDDGRFQAAALVWMVMSGWLYLWTQGFSIGTLVTLLPAGGLWAITGAYVMAATVVRLRTWALGDRTMPVEPTFDRAEAAERRGDSEGALDLFRDAVQRHPGHPETRRRLGEAFLKAGDVDQGIAELRTALGLTEDPERKILAALRVVDLLVGKKKDLFNAGLILQEIERDYAGTKVGELARARRLALSSGGGTA
ncbi:MAG: tetratricopeptide repeat protein [Candidatus Brocadiae bacterium]|nr:tetratricopeptide repeat protein [Candidatus Brocadiia bacterium]